MSTDLHWEAWGVRDAYFGVLTDERFRADALDAEGKKAFFDSGRAHVDYLFDICRRRVRPDFAPRRALDFGCGVGRVAVPLSEHVDEVVGLDVSASMLAEARRNCDEYRRENVSLRLSDDALSTVDGQFDLVHSCIVLQHIEIERGRRLFERLVDVIAPGGVGAIQVTFGVDLYPERYGQPPTEVPVNGGRDPAVAALRGLPGRLFGRRRPEASTEPTAPMDPEMRMYYYNMSELMFVLMSSGVGRMHVEYTNHGGALGAFLFFATPER